MNSLSDIIGGTLNGIQLYINTLNEKLTHKISKDVAVDLGLSVKWSHCNIGAQSPEQCGNFYAWGEISLKSGYFLNNYFSGFKDSNFVGTEKDPLRAFVYPNNKSIGGTQYDAATAELGLSWRMPTSEECQELIDKCVWSTIQYQNKIGMRVVGPNSKAIFIPCTGVYTEAGYNAPESGHYWSASPTDNEDKKKYAQYLFFSIGRSGVKEMKDDNRYEGRCIRPVTTMVF